MAGDPGMKGQRGTIMYDDNIAKLTEGDKGYQGIPGREGEVGWPGYL